MVVALVLVLAAVFGGADQYLGSLSAHPWAADISLLSAPWLAIAFLAGWTQNQPKRAAGIGLACTVTALAGYAVMTLSPVENAQLTTATLTGFVRSERLVLLGGVVTGPLFGWFGQQWRVRRARLGAAVTALAICLEPLVRIPAHRKIGASSVTLIEISVGVLAMSYVAIAGRKRGPVST